MNLCSFDHR